MCVRGGRVCSDGEGESECVPGGLVWEGVCST